MITLGALALIAVGGCRIPGSHLAENAPAPTVHETTTVEPAAYVDESAASDADVAVEPIPLPAAEETPLESPEQLRVLADAPLSLLQVVDSIRNHFPLIRQAAAARGIASGERLSAAGAFDHKLEGFTESQPLDFYENYRSTLGVKRDTYWGGQTFAGYRIGRGSFEPWYLERETNKGGEFKAGFLYPLVRDRWIDANRAELWRARLEQRRVEPEILAQIILFVRDGSVAYWNWVAAGENYRIAAELLQLANVRNEGLQEQVKAQEKAEIDLVDNRRIIVSREASLIDARRKLEQAAVKLSLFNRTVDGQPLLADTSRLPGDFVEATPLGEAALQLNAEPDDIGFALARRPELSELQIVRQQLCVALRQAQNETWPDVDGGILVAQDVGEPTSSKRDKSEFELEALVTVSVPLERRKARGKIRSLRSKLAQVRAKNQFAADKIAAEVRLSRAALQAASERVIKANESYDLAIQMREAEQELFNQGQSTLFNLNIREQQAAEAATGRVQAMLEFVTARADYAAALGHDYPNP